jgi:hypothetical protein
MFYDAQKTDIGIQPASGHAYHCGKRFSLLISIKNKGENQIGNQSYPYLTHNSLCAVREKITQLIILF